MNIVIDRFRKAGREAYIVGGAVRDAFLNRPVKDWDVATATPRDTIRQLFDDKTCVALKHDTVTVVIDGEPIQITPFRGSKKRLRSDLSHRDFTVNAMAVDPQTQRLIDPHNGYGDLRDKRIRAVGSPSARFREDPARLVRAVRLQSELNFRIDAQTLTAIPQMADWIRAVSPERIRDELIKILLTQRPSRAFHIMRTTGLIARLIPELLEGHLLRQNRHHQHTVLKHTLMTVDRVPPDPVLRLSALFHDIAKPRIRTKAGGDWRFYGHEKASARMAESILKRLKFSNETIRITAHLITHHLIDYTPRWTDAAIRRFIRRVGEEHIPSLLSLRKADLTTHSQSASALKRLKTLEKRIEAQIRSHPPMGLEDLCIDGHRVMAETGLPRPGNRPDTEQSN
ncbi:MAG: HD domain-containing protein [Deltaproteobacteria bacterium]|nr:HD domain-containing protein [Deltaproteobacteria bacterium]